MNIMRAVISVLVSLTIFTAGCQPQPTPAPCPAIQRSLAFLENRYNPNLGLLNEAPQVAPNTYWLTNDNALALLALKEDGCSN